MPKILGQAGTSLADVYDVAGSIAGIETLRSEEVAPVHDMGQTIFSERLSGDIRNVTTGAIAQNTNWDLILSGAPVTPTRILGVMVFTDVVARVGHVTLSLRTDVAAQEQEVPLFAWDSTIGATVLIRTEAFGTVADRDCLINVPGVATLPSLLIGEAQPVPVADIAFRGDTNGFGAGTVTISAVILRAFSQVEGLSSFGLPIPGW